jgi:hypothetical protein
MDGAVFFNVVGHVVAHTRLLRLLGRAASGRPAAPLTTFAMIGRDVMLKRIS